jgi:hypothetical protein
MAKRTLLKFRNLDLTRDLNDRFTKLIKPGIVDGGLIVPVPSQLKVDITPYKLISADGMVVVETSDSFRLDTPAGQTTVIAIRAIYKDNDNPDVQEIASEIGTFNILPDLDKHVVVGHVTLPVFAVEVESSNINYAPRDIIDPVGRNSFRGVISNPAALPALHNVLGDYYMVVDGVGGLPNIYAWNGSQWVVLTDFVSLNTALNNHRDNLYVDEKHLTDAEKDAVVGTSGVPVSSSNKLVDNSDPRIPTQNQKDALAGSHGSPNNANRYITQSFPVSVPQEKSLTTAPSGDSVELLSIDGPFYVGLSGTGSANNHFSFYHLDEAKQREYVTSTGVVVKVEGVYTDALLANELNPTTNPNVDSDGFFSGTLYLKFDVQPDTGLRVVYGRKQSFGSFPVNALGRRTSKDAQTSADTVVAIEAIKGRSFDTTPPVNEQNIELRKDIVDTKQYLGAVFKADHVVGDFTKVEGVPDFQGDFETNVGIPQSYTFENTSLTSYTYAPSTGVITYASSLALGSVVPGNVFIDGAGTEFKVVSTNGTNQVTVTRRNGSIPLTLNTTVTTSRHGSVKVDNNPRKINLSSLAYLTGRDRVSVREIEPLFNEFDPVTGNIAFRIRKPLRTPYYPEPRVRFYGGFENRDSGPRAKVVCTGIGRISVTGFFTHLHLLADVMAASPVVNVYIDGSPTPTPVDLSRSGSIADLGTPTDIQQQSISLAAGLADGVPHTVEIDVSNNVDDFIIYGFDLFRSNAANTLILPGRAFVQSDLYKADSIVSVTSPAIGASFRGAVTKRFINRNLTQQTITHLLTDLDGSASTPSGTAIPGSPNFTVTGGLAKFSHYRAGDVVKLIISSAEEVKIIQSITAPDQIVFTTDVDLSGAAILHHLGSTTGEALDPTKEANRFLITDFGVGQLTDFSTPFTIPSDRTFTLEDGTTSLGGKNVRYVTTGIDGIEAALQLEDSTSELRLRAVCSQMDLLVVNSGPTAANISINGSPSKSFPVPGGGLLRLPVLLNARYQTHEINISNSAGLAVAGIILHEPDLGIKIEGSQLATQNTIARYVTTRTSTGNIIPTGSVALNPHVMGAIYANGTGVGSDWATTIDFNENLAFGRFSQTDREGSYIEFSIFGGGFEAEFWADLNKGRPVVFINGVLATSANFSGSTFINISPSTGEVDMYSPTKIRKRFGMVGLSEGIHHVRIQVQTPRQRNGASFGFLINLTTVYLLNTGGSFAVTPSKGFREQDFLFGLKTVRDERNFDSGAVAREQIPVVRAILAPSRSQRVPLPIGSTSVNIVFSSSLQSTDYAVACNLFNTVDATPEFQPITITNVTASGFTAKWNDPLDTSNYFLSYTATVFS